MFRELLGDSGAALHHLARLRVAQKRPRDPLPDKRGISIKSGIFRRKGRVLHGIRYLGKRDDGALLFSMNLVKKYLPRAIKYLGGLNNLLFVKLLRPRKVAGKK